MKRRILSLIIIVSLMFANSPSVLGAEGNLGSWEIKASMPTARGSIGVVEVDGKIYAIGGIGGEGNKLDIVEQYDPHTNTWVTKANMPTSRYALGAAVANGKIYAIGGMDSQGNMLNIVEEYDPVTDTWTTKANMLTNRYTVAVVEANGKIYAIGGNNNGPLNTVEEYDPITDTWTTKASMPTARGNLGVGQIDGKIYAIGGLNEEILDVVELYDPLTDIWTSKTNLIINTAGLGVTVLDEKLYAIGGSNGSSYLKDVQVYNQLTESWSLETSISMERGTLGAISHSSKIYAIGGTIGGIGGQLDIVEEFTPSNEVIEIPLNLIATPNSKSIVLNWDTVQDADSYTILRSTTSSAIDTVIATDITVTTYTDTNVTSGVTYYYVVRAVKNGVESADSNVASAMVEENTNFANLQIKLSTTDIYEYRMTMNDVDKFMNWYIDRSNGTGLPFYSFPDDTNIEPYTDINEYLIFDKIIWFKVKEYLK
ncbi:hypothetical protein HZI73_19685 [Vallitalea pronyensis]|uniref:Fibronectin type-III domain-containing protein n=1 Tax=Vallitalea pronyensis TaxID=1348613 RepID=A0A8J8MMB7_9FIRM|nr:fibronectin type III domain-containing protein [Vallitalea pronyensis]QUI24380.1 hypothetical protein HZI73_19685 [Vallitalea pronyensis]